MQTQSQTPLPALTPLGQPATAGPWTITVLDVVSGDAAAKQVSDTNAGNASAPDGVGYLLAHVQVANTNAAPQILNMADFTATGNDGVLRPAASLAGPTPELQGTVAAGASLDGWLPMLVDDPAKATLWFESILLGGDWSSAILGLTEQSAIPTFFAGAAASDVNVGSDPANPAAVGTAVQAGDWSVTVIRTGRGHEIYDISDYGVQAFASGKPEEKEAEIATWFSVYLSVTNTSPRPATFSQNALMLCDTNGEAWDNVMALTAPAPDVSRRLVPGATREGWVAFRLKPYSPGNLARVAPSLVADAPKYVALSGSASTSTQSTGTPVATTPLDVVAGDSVMTTDDQINLRDQPSDSGKIVLELPKATKLTVTGDPVEADGYTWIPVTVDATGENGYVVSTYLAAGS